MRTPFDHWPRRAAGSILAAWLATGAGSGIANAQTTAGTTGQTAASAQTTPPPAPPPAPAAGTETPRVDLMDLIRQVRKLPPAPDIETEPPKTRMVLVPIIAAKPTTGLRVGVGAVLEIPLGDRQTRLSTLNTSVTFSTKKQVAASFQPLFYGKNEAWMLTGENQISPPALRDVPVGQLADDDTPEVSHRFIRFFDTYARRVTGRLYVGAGFFYARQSNFVTAEGAPSAFVDYSIANGFDLNAQTSAGPSVSVILDSRDHPNDATRGYLADVSYRMYIKGFLGGESTWQRMLIDLRAYRRVSRTERHRVAVWGFADVITNGTAPYFSLPTMGGDMRGRSGRGYEEGQVRGERLVSVEAEYRAMLMANGLIGLAVFANATTVGNPPTGVRLFDAIHPGAGAGLRFQLQKRSRTNLCVDFGFRKGAFGVYAGLMDTF